METARESTRARHERTSRASTLAQHGVKNIVILNHFVTNASCLHTCELVREVKCHHAHEGVLRSKPQPWNIRALSWAKERHDRGRGKRKVTKGKKEGEEDVMAGGELRGKGE